MLISFELIKESIKPAASAELGRISLSKIDEVKFDVNGIAPTEQFGDITFAIKIRAR